MVAIALASHANKNTHECYPALKTIAEKLGISQTAVGGALKILRANGIVKTQRRRRLSTFYTLIQESPIVEESPKSRESLKTLIQESPIVEESPKSRESLKTLIQESPIVEGQESPIIGGVTDHLTDQLTDDDGKEADEKLRSLGIVKSVLSQAGPDVKMAWASADRLNYPGITNFAAFVTARLKAGDMPQSIASALSPNSQAFLETLRADELLRRHGKVRAVVDSEGL
jgi:DNA-binding MarR family transcriptional regulator